MFKTLFFSREWYFEIKKQKKKKKKKKAINILCKNRNIYKILKM